MTSLITVILIFLAQVSTPAPGSSILGRVITEEGQPVANVVIRLHRKEYRNGVERLTPVVRITALTNSAGEFQIAVPDPGKYYLSAVASQQTIGRYYPGTVDSSQAEPIDVSREDVRIADLVFSQVPVFAIRGRFIQPAGIRPRSGVYGVFRLDKLKTNDFSPVRLGIDGDPERFEVHVPTPGTYGLSFSLITDTEDYLGRTVVEVRDSNVEGVTVVAVPGGKVVVRATLDTYPVAFSQIHIDPDDATFRPSIARPNSEGVLTLRGVYATRYNVGIDGLPRDLYISRVRYNGVDSTVPAFEPSENVPEGTLDIYLAKGSRIGGKAVNDEGSSPKGAVVALIPADRNRHDLYADTRAGEDGVFQFDGVPPGKYRLFAWDAVPDGAFLNADFMKPFESRGSDIIVENESHQDISLRILRTRPFKH